MTDLFDPQPGQTVLTAEDRAHLLPGHIRLRSELNEWEQHNINKVLEKYLLGPRTVPLFDPEVLKKIHKEMFDETWRWAGQYRQSNTNLGKEWHQIPEEMKKGCDDWRYWDEHATYPTAEIAVRFHHRLVVIHSFPNGNGRHARLVADIYLRERQHPLLAWGSGKLQPVSTLRTNYIKALQEADRGNLAPLIAFANS